MSGSARWRAPAAVACLLLVALLAPVAVVVTWTAELVLATSVALVLPELISLGTPSTASAGDGT